jgi:hypothetical protein
MTTATLGTLHVDHNHWQNEINMWRDDLLAWKKEQAQLLNDIELALGANVAGLKDHATSIASHEAEVLQHENFVAKCERSSVPRPDQDPTIFTEYHDEEAKKQDRLRETHERIKRHHHRSMARLTAALHALGQVE